MPRTAIARGRIDKTILLAAAVAILVVAGAGVAVTGLLSSGTGASGASARGGGADPSATLPRVTDSASNAVAPSTTAAPSADEQTSDRGEIVSLLDQYQSAYSAHETSALAKLFAAQIVRHGLAAGGCAVSRGLSAVLADYESQFREGSGSYTLVALAAGQVQFDGGTRAHLDGHYRITPGGSGYVNFKFTDTSEGWRISEVYATCE